MKLRDSEVPLAAWLLARKISCASFAQRVAVNRGHLHHVATGGRLPGLELALAIERETKGAITAESWVEKSSEHGGSGSTASASPEAPVSFRSKRSAPKSPRIKAISARPGRRP